MLLSGRDAGVRLVLDVAAVNASSRRGAASRLTSRRNIGRGRTRWPSRARRRRPGWEGLGFTHATASHRTPGERAGRAAHAHTARKTTNERLLAVESRNSQRFLAVKRVSKAWRCIPWQWLGEMRRTCIRLYASRSQGGEQIRRCAPRSYDWRVSLEKK